ncbi:MAG TPA: hypothetical protein VMR49_02420 [Candidatus Paceibacterota bacterium]|nr:hypothetical protein [Candidatus Paceibacterota bacterium]
MKKILPYILIISVIANFFAPISVGMDSNYRVNVKSNTASAAGFDDTPTGYKNAFPNTSSVVSAGRIDVIPPDNKTATMVVNITLSTGVASGGDASDNWSHAQYEGEGTGGVTFFADNDFILVIKDNNNPNLTGWLDVTNALLNLSNTGGMNYLGNMTGKSGWRGDSKMPISISNDVLVKDISPIGTPGLSSLQAGGSYTVTLYYKGCYDNDVTDILDRICTGGKAGVDILQKESTLSPVINRYFSIASTPPIVIQKQGTTGGAISKGQATMVPGAVDTMPYCFKDPFDLSPAGCAAQLLYYVLFVPTSFVFALTGRFFDFVFAYSISDSSYRSAFVVQGWGLVRDFCNMFFIFVLLYIAFATILNLQGFKTKEMIINVVIIGILINFSLFATQVIIDTSNILARVFYNSNAITITQNSTAGTGLGTVTAGPNGELPLSAALVNKVNPQNLIINANQVGYLPDKGGVGNKDKTTLGTGTFILVTLLATAVNIVGLMVFLSVGLIFVARVVGLWLAMIFVPLAFFSYTVPAMQGLDYIGWKKWWPETLKLAFLAPIFIFFLYLILKFLDTGLSLINAQGQSGLAFVVSIMLPFIFIMVLLMKAKDVARTMSGTMGQGIVDGVKKYGGMAAGAGLGVAAFAGRQTIGRLATNAMQSNKFMDWAGKNKIGARALKMTSGVASGSFDARGVKIAGKDLSSTGLDVGKSAKAGGFAKIREDKVKKEEEFAKKHLDTSDYGMAELRSGNMSKAKADRVIEQIKKSNNGKGELPVDKNGKPISEAAFRTQLVMGDGLDAKTAQTVADQMSSARRNDRADQFKNSIFATNRIKANKIRKNPENLKEARQLAATVAALAAAQKATEGGHNKPEAHKEPAVQAAPAPAATPASAPSGGETHHA